MSRYQPKAAALTFPELYTVGQLVYLDGARGTDANPYRIHAVLGDGLYRLSRNSIVEKGVFRESDLQDSGKPIPSPAVADLYTVGQSVSLHAVRGTDPNPYKIHQVLGDGQYRLSQNSVVKRGVFKESDLQIISEKLMTSPAVGNSKSALAVANLDSDFSLTRLEAPPTYKEFGLALSPKQRFEAETGSLHRTARRLGALFADNLTPIAALVAAYGVRVSEIACTLRRKLQEAKSARLEQDLQGLRGNSIWAAATSGTAAIAVHLLACVLARLWKSSEAISIWTKLVDGRKKDLAGQKRQNNSSSSPSTVKLDLNITKKDLSDWDSSARAWLQTADESLKPRQTLVTLLLENQRLLADKKDFVYPNALHEFNKASATVNRLVQGIPQLVAHSEALLGLLSWHIYPDVLSLDPKPTTLRQHDQVVNPGGILTLGLGSQSSANLSWSLPLRDLRYHSATEWALPEVIGRVTIDGIPIIIVGGIMGAWRECPGWESLEQTTEAGIHWLKKINECLQGSALYASLQPDPTQIKESTSKGPLNALNVIGLLSRSIERTDRGTVQRLFVFGQRLCRQLWPSLSSAPERMEPFLGISRLNCMLELTRDSNDRVKLLRSLAARLRPDDDSMVVRYQTDRIRRYEITSVSKITSKMDVDISGTAARYVRWMIFTSDELHRLRLAQESLQLEPWLEERISEINSEGELCLAALEAPDSIGSMQIFFGHGRDFIESLADFFGNSREGTSIFYYTGDTQIAALYSKYQMDVVTDPILTLREIEYMFTPDQVDPDVLAVLVSDLERQPLELAREIGMFKAYNVIASLFAQFPQFNVRLDVFQKPLLSAWWLRRHAQSSVLSLSRSQALSCVTLFALGVDIDLDHIEAFAVAFGDSIFLSEFLLCDPFLTPPGMALRRISANLGHTGVLILVPVKEPKFRRPDPKNWQVYNLKRFDGILSDCFQNTTLHLSGTSRALPVVLPESGGFQESCSYLETVLSVYDRGEWVADLDLSLLPTGAISSSQIRRVVCEDSSVCGDQAPMLGGVSIENWTELLDPPEGEVLMVQACGNWQARLASTVVAAMTGCEVLLLPSHFCWNCCSVAVGETKEKIKAAPGIANKIVVILGDNPHTRVLSRNRRPSNERERRVSPILYGGSPNDPQSGYSLGSIPNDHNVPGPHSLDRSLAGSSDDSDSDSDMQSAQETLTTFGKNRNKSLKAKSSNKQTGQFRPKIGQEKLLHTPRAYYNELCELKSRIYQKSALAALCRHTPAYSLSYMSASGLRISLANDDVFKSLDWLDTDENDEVSTSQY